MATTDARSTRSLPHRRSLDLLPYHSLTASKNTNWTFSSAAKLVAAAYSFEAGTAPSFPAQKGASFAATPLPFGNKNAISLVAAAALPDHTPPATRIQSGAVPTRSTSCA